MAAKEARLPAWALEVTDREAGMQHGLCSAGGVQTQLLGPVCTGQVAQSPPSPVEDRLRRNGALVTGSIGGSRAPSRGGSQRPGWAYTRTA